MLYRACASMQVDSSGAPRVWVGGDAEALPALELALRLLMRVDLPGFLQTTGGAPVGAGEDAKRPEHGVGG